MPPPEDSAVVYKLGAASAVVRKGATDAAEVYKLPARHVALTLEAYITSAVPAGAMQAEDATYLLTEDGNYLETES